MHIMWFTERAYHHVPEDEVLKLRSFFGVPNKFFDPQKARSCSTSISTRRSIPTSSASTA